MKTTSIDLLSLRPRDNSSAAVAEAITNAEAVHAQLRDRVAEMESRRADLLLSGSPAELAEGESALGAARGELEQLTAMLTALQGRHSAATKSEALNTVHAARAEAEAALAARAAWWERHGPMLHAAIREGRDLSQTAGRAVNGFSAVRMHVSHKYAEAEGIPAPSRPESDNDGWHHDLRAELSRV